MSDMETIRPRLRALVMAGEDHRIDPWLWQAAYEHLRGTDIDAAAITAAIAEFRREKAERKFAVLVDAAVDEFRREELEFERLRRRDEEEGK